MGIEHLWDTNTAIYYLQQQFPPRAEKFMDILLKKGQPAISAITEIELLCWKAATEKDLEVLHNFITDARVIELEHPIKLRTAEVRKAYRLKLPDAIIAATAMVYDLTLVTRNTQDFKNVNGLELINPWEL
ncbi:MAG: type II toxin-antitoxin system VapC family toxin [Chitinophagaceae bacterium]|nr:MAG: type II toxin-antitoxin system VapC family toxin [Chitinophagaceae bacterium]